MVIGPATAPRRKVSLRPGLTTPRVGDRVQEGNEVRVQDAGGSTGEVDDSVNARIVDWWEEPWG